MQVSKVSKRFLIVFSVLVVVWAGFHQLRMAVRRTTVTRLSPDETFRAHLVETSPRWSLDRNFRVQLESLTENTTITIFHSPDEGRPEGTERLIWSKDGTILLLVGRHFFVKEDLFLDNGDQLYFLYQPGTGKGWCNAGLSDEYPRITADQIQRIEFTEPIVLRQDPGGLKAP